MAEHTEPTEPKPHYREPGWFTRNVFNKSIAGLTRLGVSVWGSRVLEVPGRKTGEPRQTPVNVLTHEGEQYLVSPRGNGQWVRNLRAAGRATISFRGRTEQVRGTELDAGERVAFFRDVLAPLARSIPGGTMFVRVVDRVDLRDPERAAEGRRVFELHALP